LVNLLPNKSIALALIISFSALVSGFNIADH